MSMLLKPLEPKYIALYAVAVVAFFLYFRPSHDDRRPDPTDAGYQAACEGPPLRTIERRDQAHMDGYETNARYDCIDKASFAAVAKQKATWEAAHTPEAIAKQQADRERKIAEDRAARQAAEDLERAKAAIGSAPSNPVIVSVDVNNASESELANVRGVGFEIAAQIIQERSKRRFRGWEDVVARVVGLHAAQTAVIASVNGLTVDGESLPGAAPDSEIAASVRQRFSD